MNHKLIVGSSTYMDEVDDEIVNLIVTSPPYGSSVRDYTRGKTETNKNDISKSWDSWLSGIKNVINECYRVLVPDGVLAVNISNVLEKYCRKCDKVFPNKMTKCPYCNTGMKTGGIKTNYVRHVANIIEHTDKPQSCFFHFLEDVIWLKPEGAFNINRCGHWVKSEEKPRTWYPLPLTEHILIYKKVSENKKGYNGQWDKNYYKAKLQTDIKKDYWYFNTVPARLVEHPAVFPFELPDRLIRLYTFKEDIVLDPFAGSGTTLEAAALAGRSSIGYEIYEQYIEVIVDKMEKFDNMLSSFEVFRRR